MVSKIILSLIVAVGLTGCGQADEKETTNEKQLVKVGVVTQLSGNMAMVGEGIKNAISLAQEDLKHRSLKNDYEFIIEDDGYEARKTALIYPKLQNLDKVDAFLSTFSQTGKIISPQAEKSGIIHISLSSESENAKGKYNFLDLTIPKYTSGRMLQFYKDKGFKKIVSIIPNNAGPLVVEKAFMEQLKPGDGIEVKRFLIPPEEKDFRLLLNKTKQEKADAYLALLYGASFVPFFKQYQEGGEEALITSIETFAVLPDFSIAEGAYFTDAASANPQFVERYKKRFGQTSSYGVGNMYDMVMLLVMAFENAESKELAIDELAKIKTYDGVVGKLTQDSNGIFNSEAVLKKIINGQPVIVEE